MDRLLQWHVAAPWLLALTVAPFLLAPAFTEIALLVAMVPAAYYAGRATRHCPRGRVYLVLVVPAYLCAVVTPVDRFLHDRTTTYWSFVAGLTAAALWFGAAVALHRVRYPHQTVDGLVDGFAALTAVVVLQWQWLMLDGASGPVIAARTVPFVGLFLLLTVIGVLWGLIRDPRQSRILLAAVLVPAFLISGSVAGSASYSTPDVPAWTVSSLLVAGYLLAAFYRSDITAVFEPAPPSRHVFSMRWFGPAAALAATPLMTLLFVVRGAVPTVTVALVCAILTGFALWRGMRVIREREHTRRQLEGEQRFRALVEHSADVILVVEDSMRVRYAGGGTQRLLGRSPQEVLGCDTSLLLGDTFASDLRNALALLPDAEGASTSLQEDLLLNASGEQRWASVRVTNRRARSDIAGWVLNLHDITDRKRAEQTLVLQAHYDALTGLPNRADLRRRLEQLVRDHPARLFVLFCDLDGFKAVNDTLGHEAGDELLRAVAGRWSALVRGNDVLGRWGGDEFVVICEARGDAASEIAARLVQALQEPFELSAGRARVGASVGVAAHRDHEPVDELLARVDARMYAIKRGGPSPRGDRPCR